MPWTTGGGVSLHYTLDRGHGPSAIFVHEIGGSVASWDGVAPALAGSMRVLRYDQRGFGLSEKVRAPYSIDTLIEDLEHVVAAAALPPPFHVVSLAASSMQALELEHYESVRR